MPGLLDGRRRHVLIVATAAPGARIAALDTMYPCELIVAEAAGPAGAPLATTYGYVLDGSARVHTQGVTLELEAGGAFAMVDRFELEPRGRVVTVVRHGFRGTIGCTRIEARGRLSYIDGCSDSVLFAPPRLGDPVLNHLHFPAGTDQTRHAHPSVRLGVVARGTGTAHGPGWERPLATGTVFLLDAHEVHAFRTDASSMDVIAFHPDSDWGPTDGDHPMRNRTYVGARA